MVLDVDQKGVTWNAANNAAQERVSCLGGHNEDLLQVWDVNSEWYNQVLLPTDGF